MFPCSELIRSVNLSLVRTRDLLHRGVGLELRLQAPDPKDSHHCVEKKSVLAPSKGPTQGSESATFGLLSAPKDQVRWKQVPGPSWILGCRASLCFVCGFWMFLDASGVRLRNHAVAQHQSATPPHRCPFIRICNHKSDRQKSHLGHHTSVSTNKFQKQFWNC